MYLYRSHVNPDTWARAKKLRESPTSAERGLRLLLAKRALGVRFHFQKVMLGYIVDFWAPRPKLVVEIDGPSHDKAYDALKDSRLRGIGVKEVLRFSSDLLPEEIFERISAYLQPQMSFPEPAKRPQRVLCEKHPMSGKTEWGTCWSCYAELCSGKRMG